MPTKKKAKGILNHKEIYFQIVNEKNLDTLTTVMQEQEILEYYSVKKVEIHNSNGFPYILFYRNIKEVFAAQFLGIFFDIKKLIPAYSEDLYYLPVVGFCEDYEAKISKLINKDLSIDHEIIHLKDLLDLIEKDPDYVNRVRKYTMTGIKNSRNLTKSIDLEVFKIFYLEPKALTHNFENGENYMLSEFGPQIIKYTCSELNEYLQMMVADYIDALQDYYIRKLAKNKDLIKEGIKNSVNKYGVELFGEKPYETMLEVKRAASKKMFKALISRKFVNQ